MNHTLYINTHAKLDLDLINEITIKRLYSCERLRKKNGKKTIQAKGSRGVVITCDTYDTTDWTIRKTI